LSTSDPDHPRFSQGVGRRLGGERLGRRSCAPQPPTHSSREAGRAR
jgi:hypothetical protein